MTKQDSAAFGGPGWSPRTSSLRDELGGPWWAACGIDSEYAELAAVLLHRPGAELDAIDDPNLVQMLAQIDGDRARAQHDALAAAYRAAGVAVHYVDPAEVPPPNLLFVADLLFMTRAGAVVGRPASTVRAGEERWVARRLADLGIPILRSVGGRATFEGADAMWIDRNTVVVALGLRTNPAGAAQLTTVLAEMGVSALTVRLVPGAMHLMGVLRVVDRDLSVVWSGRTPASVIAALEERGHTVLKLPDQDEAERGMALNFVVVGPRRIVMPAGNPITEALYRDAGIECVTVEVDELGKAAGGIGCMTGILHRKM